MKKHEPLDVELQEIKKEIFHKDSAEKIISDKIIKFQSKNCNSKILFIHAEVQSHNEWMKNVTSGDYQKYYEKMYTYKKSSKCNQDHR